MTATSRLALLVLIISGCRQAPTFETADRVTLFSLDGFSSGEVDYQKHPPAEGTFYGRGVLGHTELSKPERLDLAAALKRAIAEEVSVAGCFMPRHGLRLEKGGRRIDYVICFECGQFFTTDGESARDFTTVSDSPEPIFDKILTNAGIELAPKSGTDEYLKRYEEMTR